MKKNVVLMIIAILLFPAYLLAEVESPSGFDLKATSSTIEVTWTANTNADDDSFDDTEGYYIDYWETDDTNTQWTVQLVGVTRHSFTIEGLESGINYSVRLSAYNGDTESNTSSDTIYTEAVGEDDINIVISGTDAITISFDVETTNFDYFSVKVGTTSGGDEIYGSSPVNIDIDDSLSVSGLTAGTTYYVTVSVDPDTDPDDDFPVTIPFLFESTHTLMSSAEEDIENGCFINSSESGTNGLLILIISSVVCFLFRFLQKAWRFFPVFIGLVLVIVPVTSTAGDSVLYKNNFGIKGGFFLPNENDQQDVYDEIIPFSLFYERMLTRHFSADIDLGYSKTDGTALSASSSSTELETELTMYPASVSVNFNYDVAPYMTAFVGLGGDWWFVEEKSEIGEFDSEVGGWHVKTGLKIFSDELETFKQVGCLIDVSYTEIDRFGQNDVDLGGWKFNIGLMYCM